MTTAILAVLGLLLFSSLNLEVKGYCESNGCSIPRNLPFPYKRYFNSACNKHDICYSCHCVKYAGIYYGAVRVGGNKHYEVPSKYWCSTCPSSKGDPSLRVSRR